MREKRAPRRSPRRSDKARVPDDRGPLEASVQRRWRESSKRSSASVPVGAPFRGKGIARPEQPREPKQSWRAQSPHAWMSAIAQRARFAGRPIPSKHNHVLHGHGPYRGTPRPRSRGCRLATRSGHLVPAGTGAAPYRPEHQRDLGRAGLVQRHGRAAVERSGPATFRVCDLLTTTYVLRQGGLRWALGERRCRGASWEETGSAGRDALRLLGSHVKHCPLAARSPHPPPPQLPASIAEVARVRSVACLSAPRFTVAAAAGDGFRVVEHDAQRR
jgi:hypothetical protein